MDTGKIVIGIALVMFSAALIVHPTSAYGYNVQRGGSATVSPSGIGIAPETMLQPSMSTEAGRYTRLPTVLRRKAGGRISDLRAR